MCGRRQQPIAVCDRQIQLRRGHSLGGPLLRPRALIGRQLGSRRAVWIL